MDMITLERPSMDELNLLHADVCQALGDPKRLNILYALHQRPRHVSQLAADLQMPQPTVSRHLQILRDRHLVIAERDGAAVVYHLAEPRVIEVLDTMRLILRDSLARRTGLVAAEN
ncbi:MAG: winged helix-turn-helix transcriptional regulator [Candidatus Promineofilum sp.]|nr:winged helix-turn-helix transcriptional regulator [Promineifilum sp.]